MDWFSRENLNRETIDFPIIHMGLSGFNFPWNQSIDLW